VVYLARWALKVAINAIKSAAQAHRFLGINKQGQVALIHTTGNPDTHVVLRGGSKGPNYDSVHIALCETALQKITAQPAIMVDCSHANANKQPELQPLVAEDVMHQIIEGNQSIVGLMLESNIYAGQQSIPADLSELQYGVSITDGCIDWKTTERVLRTLSEQLRDVLPKRG
jgi:3-deoxy-7-phosphoheptulonate synthase